MERDRRTREELEGKLKGFVEKTRITFDVEMRHHHYYQSEHKKYLYQGAPCYVYVFQDTITKDCYYRLYKYDNYEAHTLSIVKIK